MRPNLFTNLPLTVVSVNDFDRNAAPRIETTTAEYPGYFSFFMLTKRWRPAIYDGATGKFCFTKAVALSFDGSGYSVDRAVGDFHGVAHVIARRSSRDQRGGFVLALPLREIVRDRREYETITKKVAAKCRTRIKAADIHQFLPVCTDVVSMEYKWKTDVAQLLLGVSATSSRTSRSEKTVGVVP